MTQKRLYAMTDRERRIYKRRQRRQRELRRKILLFLMTFCLVVICAVSYCSIQSNASTGDEELNFKYYTKITVSYGDTLWEIADDYIDYNQYKDKEAYIAEVRNINHLDEDGVIKAGQYLVIPYYSHEFVK